MEKLLESVPNFSVGQSPIIIEKIANSIQKVHGVKLMNIDTGFHANRTVMTVLGNPQSVINAIFEGIKTATENIDMRSHKGTHPRIGAVDICPFIPFKNMEMREAIEYSLILAEKVANELQIPTFLYNESAKFEERKKLAWIRKGEYENLENKLKESNFQPDYGNAIFNPKSGICIVGARKILLAYNINLTTKEVEIAKKIASEIRETTATGLAKVRAIGWYIKEFDKVQVSCNITDYEETSIFKVFDKIKNLAQKYDTQISGSELVGMIPEAALLSDGFENIQKSIEYLGLNDVKPFFINQKIIEYNWKKL
ncbi:MAG: glutamate formimidoyltransferase [Cytophagales bacterium]|nr:MAG: glutamate formimidoyltransferase [Cytophagales bacterium]